MTPPEFATCSLPTHHVLARSLSRQSWESPSHVFKVKKPQKLGWDKALLKEQKLMTIYYTTI